MSSPLHTEQQALHSHNLGKRLWLRIENPKTAFNHIVVNPRKLGERGNQLTRKGPESQTAPSASLGGFHKVVVNILEKLGKPIQKRKRLGNGPAFPNTNSWVVLGLLTHNLPLILFVFYYLAKQHFTPEESESGLVWATLHNPRDWQRIGWHR